MAARFVREGMRVAILDVDVQHMTDAQAQIGGETMAILCDVAEVESLEHARDRIAQTWGAAPSVLVNNAVTRIGRGFDASLEDWRRAIDINLFGVIKRCACFLAHDEAGGAARGQGGV